MALTSCAVVLPLSASNIQAPSDLVSKFRNFFLLQQQLIMVSSWREKGGYLKQIFLIVTFRNTLDN